MILKKIILGNIKLYNAGKTCELSSCTFSKILDKLDIFQKILLI